MVSSTNINDEADERAYSRVAVYGSETERSTSSGESTLSSTPLSVSPMPFEFITKDAGGWSNDLARFNDGFQVRAQKSIPETGQEDEVRFSEKDHFLKERLVFETEIKGEHIPYLNPQSLITCHHRQHVDHCVAMDSCFRVNHGVIFGSSENLAAKYGSEMENKTCKDLETGDQDIEKHQHKVMLVAKGRSISQLFKHIVLAVLFCFGFLGLYLAVVK